VLRLTRFPKKEIRPQEHGARGIYLEWRSHSPCFFGARAAAARRLCEPETQLEPEPLRSDLLDLESPLQPGSAAKAAFNLERSCPIWSMAPVVAIM